MGKVIVDKVYTRKKRNLLPIMVNFENGKIATLTKANTTFCRFINKYQKKKFGALVTINENMYEGIINDREANTVTDSYVCIRNKTTNAITMIPIDEVQLKNYMLTNAKEIATKAIPRDMARKLLLERFGTRKASRYISDKEKMKINVQAMGDNLQQTLDKANIEINDNEKSELDFQYYDTIRPPFNANANVVSDIYTIHDIISHELLNNLEEEAKSVYQTKIEQLPIKSSYLLRKIAKLKEDAPSVETFVHLKSILYMDALLNLINNTKSKCLGKIELSKITEKIEDNIRENFSDHKCANYKWARTLYSVEKAICYFIVLSLIIENNYEVNWKTLSEELHMPRGKVTAYAHVVFALPKSKASSVLTLRMPSTVPSIQKSLGGKKNRKQTKC